MYETATLTLCSQGFVYQAYLGWSPQILQLYLMTKIVFGIMIAHSYSTQTSIIVKNTAQLQ